jgi:NDP-sugar pyrophosphorylase family protein
MRAIILAAGLGTRLAPLTDSTPKILVPLNGEPLLAHQLRYLETCGVTRVGINAHHHADQVTAFLDRAAFDLEVEVSYEAELLGTAGALLGFSSIVHERFIVVYGDVVTDMRLTDIWDYHSEEGAEATLAYQRASETEGKGVFTLDASGRIVDFVEKGAQPSGISLVNSGIYVLEPTVMDVVSPGADFGHDVWPALAAEGRRLYGYDASSAYIQDIGSVAMLERAELDLREGQIKW